MNPVLKQTFLSLDGRKLNQNKIEMSIKISREAYEKLIKEDLDFLNEHCPESLELDHIKAIIRSSINWNYSEKAKSMCLKDKTKVCNLCHECDVDVINPIY